MAIRSKLGEYDIFFPQESLNMSFPLLNISICSLAEIEHLLMRGLEYRSLPVIIPFPNLTCRVKLMLIQQFLHFVINSIESKN